MKKTNPAKMLLVALLLAHSSLFAAPSKIGVPTAMPTPTQSREEIVRQLEKRIRERATAQMEKEKSEAAGKAGPAQTPQPGGEAIQTKRGPSRGAPTAMPEQIAKNQPTADESQTQAPIISSEDTVLYIDPPSATARVSEPLTSTVTAVCLKQRSMDKLDLRLVYDPFVLKPVSVHYHSIASHINGSPIFEVTASKGQIRFSAQFKEPLRFNSKPLLTIIWMPLQEANHTTVELGWPDQRSALLDGEKNLLENPRLSGGSIVSFDVAVRPAKDLAIKHPFAQSAGEPTLLSGDSVWLEMDGPFGPFEQDEEFTLDIHLRNPNRARFDTVSLLVRYPQNKAKVLDWDRGNWIRNGVNIHDGDHELFPFDFFFANEVNEVSGRIYYRMASTNVKLDAEGLLAQIRVRALSSDLSSEDFELVFNGNGGPRTTEISLDGKPLLGGALSVEN